MLGEEVLRIDTQIREVFHIKKKKKKELSVIEVGSLLFLFLSIDNWLLITSFKSFPLLSFFKRKKMKCIKLHYCSIVAEIQIQTRVKFRVFKAQSHLIQL